ncbi:MAG: cytochrome b/b6 domain-containing protein [Ignavibacteriaceae bacterium]|nr:cytochrome b/b6 domain-containing protein [Ignavibacteriaceae bacterium]
MTSKSFFINTEKEYSAVYRILHWGLAISFILLLLTIFLRMTWLNRDNVAAIIKPFLAEKEIVIPQEELITLAKQIRKPMWIWHTYLGYVITFLFVIRLSLPFFGKMKFQNPFNKTISGKERFQYLVYIIFYLCVSISLITGLIIDLGPKDLRKEVESIHKLSIYYLGAYLIFHLGGVLIAEFTNQKGLISKIISGGNSTNKNKEVL